MTTKQQTRAKVEYQNRRKRNKINIKTNGGDTTTKNPQSKTKNPKRDNKKTQTHIRRELIHSCN